MIQVSAPKTTPRTVQTVEVRTRGAGGVMHLSATGPIRVLQPEKSIAAGEQRTLFSIYLPATWADTDRLRFRYLSEGKETVHEVPLTAETRYGFKSRMLGATTLHLPPDQDAEFRVEVVNLGNRSQNFILELENPQNVRSTLSPPQLLLKPGTTGQARITLRGALGIQAQTLRIRTLEDPHEERLYFFLESYPNSLPSESLYSRFSGRTQWTVGEWNGEPGGLWQLGFSGPVQKDVLLDLFVQESSFPADTVMPGGDTEGRWKFSLDAPTWHVHAGEMRVAMERVWGQSLLGEGWDVAVGGLQVFGGRENLGFHDKTFGGARYRWELGPQQLTGTILGKRNDVAERGGDWEGGSLRWDYARGPWKSFAELGMTRGGLGSGSSGYGGFEYHKQPWRLRLEAGWGDERFAGALQGQKTLQGHLSWEKWFVRGFWSDYQLAPVYEPTRAEILLDPQPDFLRRNGSHQLAVGWQGSPWSWSLERRESFQSSDFSQHSTEDFAQLGWRHSGERSQVGLAVRGGREVQMLESSFAELSADWSYAHERTQWNAGARLTHNFQDDQTAINRSGAHLYGGSWYSRGPWEARVEGQAYAYQNSQTGRVQGSLRYQLRDDASVILSASSAWHSDAQRETGLFLSFVKTFGMNNRTYPIRGRVSGVVFDDRNGNGIQERAEQGLPNVLTRYGDVPLLTDARGRFSYPAMPPGLGRLKVVPDFGGEPILPSKEVPPTVEVRAGKTTWVPMGWIRPVEVAGTVLLASYDALSGGRSRTAPDAARRITFTAATTHEVNTRGNGSFSILLPPGRYLARIEGEDLEHSWEEHISTDGKTLSILLQGRKPRIIKTFHQ